MTMKKQTWLDFYHLPEVAVTGNGSLDIFEFPLNEKFVIFAAQVTLKTGNFQFTDVYLYEPQISAQEYIKLITAAGAAATQSAILSNPLPVRTGLKMNVTIANFVGAGTLGGVLLSLHEKNLP